MNKLKLASWNVNGIRAIAKKSLDASLAHLGADVIGFQETKAQDDQVREALFGLPGLESHLIYSTSAQKKGYAGTAILSKVEPLNIKAGICDEPWDNEGRVLAAEFENFHFVTVYTPNSSSALKRLPFRKKWDIAFRAYIAELDQTKPVVLCGDLNVAHAPIDLARPQANYNKTPGYTQTEIEGMSSLLETVGLVDTWREKNPETVKYSWWSYRGGAREKNVGWRLDYMLVSHRLMERIEKPEIHNEVMGSDHCPVSLWLQI
ncbi:MAG: exodeoxyribonuclease III [Flavobacteriales bacterium]